MKMKKIEKTLTILEKFIPKKDLSKYRKDGVKYVYGASTHTAKGDGYQFWMYYEKLNDELFKKEFSRRTSIVGDVIEVCISEEKAEEKAEKKEDKKKTAKEIAYEQFLEAKRQITAKNRAERSNINV